MRNLYETGQRGLRAYGEMVGLLWETGQFSAAIRVEQFWNGLRDTMGFALFCAYPIDVFSPEFHIHAIDGVLCDHTHLVPTGIDGLLERAIDSAMDAVLGSRAEDLRLLMSGNFRPAWGAVPVAESMILWLRNDLPEEAEAIVQRAHTLYDETWHVKPN